MKNTDTEAKKQLAQSNNTDVLFDKLDDLDSLLKSILNLFFEYTQTEIGSIQIYENSHLFTKLHRQFPDKIRQFFKYSDGTLISDKTFNDNVIKTIENFSSQSDVQGCPLINVTAYLCLPISFKGTKIAVINLVQTESSGRFLSLNNLQLKDFMKATGAALHNGLLIDEVKKKRAIDKQLSDALAIQEQLLPVNIPYANNFEFGCISIASKELSGDFYEFIELPNNKIGVVMVDITGKGIQAGLFMAMVKSILRIFLPESDSPKEVMRKINDVLCERKVVRKYIPVFYGIVDPETKTFTYCNAGMEPSLLGKKEGVTSLETGGPPVGAFPDSDYEEESITLSPNDFVIMITDGITDARNENEKDIGLEKVIELVKSSYEMPMQEALNKLVYYAKNFMGERPQKDDLTLVGFRMDPSIKDSFAVEPLRTDNRTIIGLPEELEAIAEKLKHTLSKGNFSDTAKDKLGDIIVQISKTILGRSYVGSNTGKLSFQFFNYQDKVEIVIQDYGQGISEGELKASLGDIYTVFDNVQFRATKIGSHIHFIKKF